MYEVYFKRYIVVLKFTQIRKMFFFSKNLNLKQENIQISFNTCTMVFLKNLGYLFKNISQSGSWNVSGWIFRKLWTIVKRKLSWWRSAVNIISHTLASDMDDNNRAVHVCFRVAIWYLSAAEYSMHVSSVDIPCSITSECRNSSIFFSVPGSTSAMSTTLVFFSFMSKSNMALNTGDRAQRTTLWAEKVWSLAWRFTSQNLPVK